MPIEWLSAYDTGIAEIDADHRGLVDLVNALEQGIEKGQTDFAPIIHSLRGYVNIHFNREETLLLNDETCSQTDRTAHLAHHQILRDTVQRIDAQYRADPGSLDPTELHADLAKWLMDEITEVDKIFGPD